MNNIPRLVGDQLNSAADTPIQENKKVILVANNYDNLDNDRELQRIFPKEFPSWIKQVILANDPPQPGNISADNGDAYPIGAVWICSRASGDFDLPNRMWVLASVEGSTAVWTEISTAEYVDNHKSSAAQVFADITDLGEYGAQGSQSENALLGYVPNASVTVSMGSATITEPNGPWFVRMFKAVYGGKTIMQTVATKADDATYQIQRVYPSPGVTPETWSSWTKFELQSRTIGEVYFSQSKEPRDNPGALPLFTGAIISKSAYPGFAAWLSNGSHNDLLKSTDKYNEIYNTYGECPYYGWSYNPEYNPNDPSSPLEVPDNIKLPWLKNYIKMANTAEGITQAKAGLPNHYHLTGYISADNSGNFCSLWNANTLTLGLPSLGTQRCTNWNGNGHWQGESGTLGSYTGNMITTLGSDCVPASESLSTGTFGSSDTVTPAHTTLYPWVFAYNTLINSSALDLAALNEQITQQVGSKMDTDAANITSIGRTNCSVPRYDAGIYDPETGNAKTFAADEWVQVPASGFMTIFAITNQPQVTNGITHEITCYISDNSGGAPAYTVGKHRLYIWTGSNAFTVGVHTQSETVTFSFPIKAGWYFKCSGSGAAGGEYILYPY